MFFSEGIFLKTMTIQEFKNTAKQQLKKSPSTELDITVLLEFALNFSKTQLLLNRNFIIPHEKLLWLNEAVKKRTEGLPVSYITGQKEFYGYNFYVTPDVLIPKPDTEVLVEKACKAINEKIQNNPNKLLTICDMCTGSGCIGLSVLRNLIEEYKVPFSKMPSFMLVDISSKALEVARKNYETLIPDQFNSKVRIVQSNLFEQIPHNFDVVLTNPPYVPHSMVEDLLQDGRNEPVLALDGDVTLNGQSSGSDDGLELIRNLMPQIKTHLNPYGFFIMETGEYNAEQTLELATKAGFKANLYKDLENTLRGIFADL